MSLPRINAVDSPEQWIVLARSAVPIDTPADTTEDVLAIISVPANAMGPNGVLRITHGWSYTNNANNKTQRIRFGGAAGAILHSQITTTQLGSHSVTQISNRGATNSQIANGGSFFNGGAGMNPTGGPTASAIDTALATSIAILGIKALAGDLLRLESYLVELLQGA